MIRPRAATFTIIRSVESTDRSVEERKLSSELSVWLETAGPGLGAGGVKWRRDCERDREDRTLVKVINLENAR